MASVDQLANLINDMKSEIKTGNLYVDGYISIGTSTPSQNLHVRSVDTTGGVAIEVNSDNPNHAAVLDFIAKDQVGIQMGHSEATGSLNIYNLHDSGDIPSLTVYRSGHVGIGMPTPSQNLHVRSVDTTGGVGIEVNSNNPNHSAVLDFIARERIGVQMAYSEATGALNIYNLHASGDVPSLTVDANGNIIVTGDVQLSGADCAEDFDVIDGV